MKVNQKYIADLLKVSRVTVTKALQDHPDIAISTRKKVKDLAQELGYIPNIVGRSLSTKKTGTIGVIVPKINHSFFSTLIEEMYLEAKNHGYKIILMVSFENEETELDNVKSLISMNVDGILMDPVSHSEKGEAFDLVEKHKKPLVYIDRKPRSIKTQNCVLFDDYNLSYSLTKQIIERGYEKLMYINGPKEINISYNRLRGFKDALKDFNIKTPENWILHAGFDKNSSKEKFLEFLKNNSNLPQAVMCVNDSTAIGVYNACKKIGVKIPEDIAVTGFGHVKVSSLLNPPLTTVKLDLKKACEVAVEKLINLIDSNNTANKNTIIGGKIIFRASVKENI